jgi:hypothetical protein
MQILQTHLGGLRSAALLVAAGILVSCSSDSSSGPAGSTTLPQIAGQWRGTVEIILDTCDNEQGIEDSGIVTITQSGSSITITTDEGDVLTGTIELNGSFAATGTLVEDGVSFAATLDGQLSGDAIQATYTAIAQNICTLSFTVLLDRM